MPRKKGYFCMYCSTELPYVHEVWCPEYTGSKLARKAVQKAPEKPKDKS